jgi:protein SCO1/2
MSPTTLLRLRTRAARLTAVPAIILVVALGFAAFGSARREDREPLPVLGRVADFALVDQTNAAVSRAALDGEPWVANFIFTRCATICPNVTGRMRAVQALARRHDDALRLVTFSVDPEHDAPAVLKSYAEAYGADQATWKFLTGSEASIEAIAHSFSVALEGKADPGKPNFGIMHSGHLVLVDGRGQIRGYYPSSEEGVENRILVDLKRLDVAPAQVAKAR